MHIFFALFAPLSLTTMLFSTCFWTKVYLVNVCITIYLNVQSEQALNKQLDINSPTTINSLLHKLCRLLKSLLQEIINLLSVLLMLYLFNPFDAVQELKLTIPYCWPWQTKLPEPLKCQIYRNTHWNPLGRSWGHAPPFPEVHTKAQTASCIRMHLQLGLKEKIGSPKGNTNKALQKVKLHVTIIAHGSRNTQPMVGGDIFPKAPQRCLKRAWPSATTLPAKLRWPLAPAAPTESTLAQRSANTSSLTQGSRLQAASVSCSDVQQSETGC